MTCYVQQPSSCTDLKNSKTDAGEQYSAQACEEGISYYVLLCLCVYTCFDALSLMYIIYDLFIIFSVMWQFKKEMWLLLCDAQTEMIKSTNLLNGDFNSFLMIVMLKNHSTLSKLRCAFFEVAKYIVVFKMYIQTEVWKI